MVRGRRVRAVVAVARNEDCCSPNPKRKDQRMMLPTTDTHNVISPKSKPQTITQFFQAVTVEDSATSLDDSIVNTKDVNLKEVEARMTTRRSGSPIKHNQLNGNVTENEDMKVGTPAPKALEDRLKFVTDGMAKPPTPHRIELCQDLEEFLQKKPPTRVALSPKRFALPPKARRNKLCVQPDIDMECPVCGDIYNTQEYNDLLHDFFRDLAIYYKVAASHAQNDILNNNNQISIQPEEQTNQKLTDFYPVRRSIRKTKKTVLEEKQRSLEHILRNNVEEGLEVHNFEGKGRGVVTSREFYKGDFVVEYSGELIDIAEAKRREQMYAQDQNTGCYMYYFKHKSQQYCIDATAESGKLGRLVNHSRNGNLLARTIGVDNKPRLILVAKDNIKVGEEVTYDYGDRSKESLKHHPWLAF